MSTPRPPVSQDVDVSVEQLELLLEACGFNKSAAGQSEYITSLYEMTLDGEVNTAADATTDTAVHKTSFQEAIEAHIAKLNNKAGTIRLVVNTAATQATASDAHWALLELEVNADGKVAKANWVDSLSGDHKVTIEGTYKDQVTSGLDKAGIKDTTFTFTHEEPHKQADSTSCGYFALMNLVSKSTGTMPDDTDVSLRARLKRKATGSSTGVATPGSSILAIQLRNICEPTLLQTAAPPPVTDVDSAYDQLLQDFNGIPALYNGIKTNEASVKAKLAALDDESVGTIIEEKIGSAASFADVKQGLADLGISDPDAAIAKNVFEDTIKATFEGISVADLHHAWKLTSGTHEQSKQTYARYIRGCELKAPSILYSANPDLDAIQHMRTNIDDIEDILLKQKASLEAMKELIDELKKPDLSDQQLIQAATVISEFNIKGKNLSKLATEMDERLTEANERLTEIKQCRKTFEPTARHADQHIYGTVVTSAEDIPCEQNDNGADAIEKARAKLGAPNAAMMGSLGSGILTRPAQKITATQITVRDKQNNVYLDSVTIKTDHGDGCIKSSFMFSPAQLKKIANLKQLAKDSPLMDWALENVKMHIASLPKEQADEPLQIVLGNPPMPDACYKALIVAAGYVGKEFRVDPQYRDFAVKNATRNIRMFEEVMTKKGMDLSEREHRTFKPK